MNEEIPHITTVDFILMLGTAIFFDILQIILPIAFGAFGVLAGAVPLIGWFFALLLVPEAFFSTILVSLLAWLTFFVWFKMKGISLLTVKRLTRNIIAGLIETFPGINFVPTWTLYVIIAFIGDRTARIIVNTKEQ